MEALQVSLHNFLSTIFAHVRILFLSLFFFWFCFLNFLGFLLHRTFCFLLSEVPKLLNFNTERLLRLRHENELRSLQDEVLRLKRYVCYWFCSN